MQECRLRRVAVAIVTMIGLGSAHPHARAAERPRFLGAHRASIAYSLFPAGGCSVQMAVIPSFEPDWGVCLTRDAAGRATVELARAPAAAWRALMTIVEDGATPGETVDEAMAWAVREFPPQVERKSAPISADAARALERLWDAALRRQYTRTPGLDGTTFFIAAGTRRPELGSFMAWSPRSGPEAGLAAIGVTLAAYVEAPESERSKIEEALLRDADALVKRL